MMKYASRFLSTLIVALALIFPAAASATDDRYPNMREEEYEWIKHVERYLNQIDSVVARFNQQAPDGFTSQGTFYLERPGKLRWQYDPPTPIIIVGRNNDITYYDYELQEVSYVSLDDTLALFLTQKHVDFFHKDLHIDEIIYQSDHIRITVSNITKPEEGSLTLIVQPGPTELVGLEMHSPEGSTTYVTFTDQHYGIDIDEKLFYIPRVKRNR